MKYFLLLTLLTGSFAFAETQKFETTCKRKDCFAYGWKTVGENYSLDTICKDQNCREFGWASVANDHSTYDVTCKVGGCFRSGWSSSQHINGKVFDDQVSCRSSNCLAFGWTVQTGYDLMGGDAVCNLGDCSKYGGESVWRGRPSRTLCFGSDCYHQGWELFVY